MKPKIDRISGLPDGILTHILSFLDTRSALRSSALSSRWKQVWYSLPSLDFYFGYQSPLPFTKSTCCNVNFHSFMDQVLKLREDSHLVSFRFSVVFQVDPSVVERCIIYALNHNVQNLKIRAFCDQRPVRFPLQQNLFTCESLKYLKLTTATADSIDLPRSLSLPNLKTMHLKNFIFSDDNYNGEIFTGCPNLETLTLCKCSIKGNDRLKEVNISGHKIRELQILYWRCAWEYQYQHKISIYCPELVKFKYKGQIAPVSFNEEPNCIEEVCIDLWCPVSCATADVYQRKVTSAGHIMGMLGKLVQLKALTLSMKTVEILSTVRDLYEHGSTTFGNLKQIRLKAEHSIAEMGLNVESITNKLKGTFIYSEKNVTLNIPMHKTHDSKNGKKKRHLPVDSIDIPTIVLSYLLLSSPSVETLFVSVPRNVMVSDLSNCITKRFDDSYGSEKEARTGVKIQNSYM